MYDSLKPWLSLTATRHPYTGRDGTGAKLFGASTEFKCYAEGKVQVVTNQEGKEVVSNKVLYIEGALEINEIDDVTFEGKTTAIKAIGYYYRNGQIDIKMVYL